MGNKNIKKEVKKKKQTDTKSSASSFALKPMVTQPALIKKKEKPV